MASYQHLSFMIFWKGITKIVIIFRKRLTVQTNRWARPKGLVTPRDAVLFLALMADITNQYVLLYAMYCTVHVCTGQRERARCSRSASDELDIPIASLWLKPKYSDWTCVVSPFITPHVTLRAYTYLVKASLHSYINVRVLLGPLLSLLDVFSSTSSTMPHRDSGKFHLIG